MEETIILEKVKAGDAAAFSLLYDLYWLKVYNFARLYVTSSSVISEVVQDVFVKVWESKEFLDITKNFDGLLFMITRNIIFNYSRRHFNELNFKMTVLKGLENSYDIEEELDAADLKNYIDKLISQLPARRQQIFRMSREEHLSNREIAERCAVSEKAIERHYLSIEVHQREPSFICCIYGIKTQTYSCSCLSLNTFNCLYGVFYFFSLKKGFLLILTSEGFIFSILTVRPNTSPSILLFEITTDLHASSVIPSLR